MPKLICFEGIDGAGKSTIAHCVAEALSRSHPTTFISKKEPPPDRGYASEHLAALRRLIWDYPRDAPLLTLGDHHWLHLMAAWFSALDHCSIRPALAASEFVVVDNWFHKFAARFVLKSSIARADVHAAFARLSTPDHIFFLDLDPEVAAKRRESISRSEAGSLEEGAGASRERFAAYQRLVRAELCRFAGEDPRWTLIPIDAADSPAATTTLVLDNLVGTAAGR